MTLTQLESFVSVARLGSVQAAAESLGVSPSAVSHAVRSLRRELGDRLYVRVGGGLELTAGGHRLAAAGGEILGLARQAQRSVREAGRGRATTLRVAATATVAEFAAAPLLESFMRRNAGIEVALQVAPDTAFAGLLEERLVDVTLGPRPPGDSGSGGGGPAGAAGRLESLPFLRYQLIVVAPPGHPLAGRARVAPAELAGERWLAGPAGAHPSTPTGAFMARAAISPARVRAHGSVADAGAEVAAGRGVMLAIAHTVLHELEEGTLVALDVRGTPIPELWHATALDAQRRPSTASTLRRFLTTPEATRAMLSRTPARGVAAARFRRVHMTPWNPGVPIVSGPVRRAPG